MTFSDKVKTFPHKRLVAGCLAAAVILGAAAGLTLHRQQKEDSGEPAAEVMDKAVVVCDDYAMDNTTLNWPSDCPSLVLAKGCTVMAGATSDAMTLAENSEVLP